MGRSVPGLVGPAGLVGTGEMGRTVQALPADASTCVYARGRCVPVASLPPLASQQRRVPVPSLPPLASQQRRVHVPSLPPLASQQRRIHVLSPTSHQPTAACSRRLSHLSPANSGVFTSPLSHLSPANTRTHLGRIRQRTGRTSVKLGRPHGTVPCVCIFPTQYPDRRTTRWSHHLKHVCLANGGLRNHVLQQLKAKAGACLNLRDG